MTLDLAVRRFDTPDTTPATPRPLKRRGPAPVKRELVRQLWRPGMGCTELARLADIAKGTASHYIRDMKEERRAARQPVSVRAGWGVVERAPAELAATAATVPDTFRTTMAAMTTAPAPVAVAEPPAAPTAQPSTPTPARGERLTLDDWLALAEPASLWLGDGLAVLALSNGDASGVEYRVISPRGDGPRVTVPASLVGYILGLLGAKTLDGELWY